MNARNFGAARDAQHSAPTACEPRFSLGKIEMTPGALRVFDAAYETAAEGGAVAAALLRRHQHGDWGDLDTSDKAANDRSLKEGTRLMSVYHLPDGTKLYVITEWDRSETTILLPEEY